MKSIEVIVAPDGSSQVQTTGFHGSECQAASKFLEQAMGKRVRETLTGEFYQQSWQPQQLNQQSD